MAAPWQERTELLLGPEGLERLAGAEVLVCGLGGVGAAAAEMLARAGVGALTLVDADSVSESNINRQLPALRSTVGRSKADVVGERLMNINPELKLALVKEFLNEETIPSLLVPKYDFVVDAIDTLSPKIALIQWCLANKLRLVSSMGSGAKTDATRVRIADISKTHMCPLAHMLRKRLHKYGISEGFLAVFSDEKPDDSAMVREESRNKRSNVGTVSWLPAVFGCVCAQAAVLAIAGKAENL
ncbi:MAG: tRNA threonylcarbamoyladenosine dehydratase [Bacteroidales bacterium]|nr:tRNA threonylcarbamoyladenosine dehydratase [Bacteroidales bacterium]